MTSQPRFGRRTLLAGAGAVAAAGVVSLAGCDDHSGQQPRPHPPGTTASGSPAVDLTVRWRHLVPRVELSGLWTDLLAGWLFDEGSGYEFADVSGHDHPLVITGHDWNRTDSGLLGAIHRAGLRGGAVYLNGTRWLAAAPAPDLVLDGRGVSATTWVRLDRYPTQPATLLAVGSAAALTVDQTGRVSWRIEDAAGGSITAESAGRLPLGGWTHVAATADPAHGTLAIAIDGAASGRLGGGRFEVVREGRAEVRVGLGIIGALDQTTLHRGVLTSEAVEQIRLLGLPRTFTQTSETIDADRTVFTRFKGSEPIPHPATADTAMTLRFATSLTSEQGHHPLAPAGSAFEPGVFGCAWLAMSAPAGYASPLTGDSGTFEAWYRSVPDAADPQRRRPAVLFTATGRRTGSSAGPQGGATPPLGPRLVLSIRGGRWRVDVTSGDGHRSSAIGPVQAFPPGALAHVAVAWGEQPDGSHAVQLLVAGRPVARVATTPEQTTFDARLVIGGTASAPTRCLVEDVRVSTRALGWGGVCPRGQMATDAAGLDLRDFFAEPPGAMPLWWRPGRSGGGWTIARLGWQQPGQTGDDPASSLALAQTEPTGLRAAYHPDAYGHASSIEAGVSVERLADGWTGVFVQGGGPGEPFSGIVFALNPQRSLLRLARYSGGRLAGQKTLPHDFAIRPQTTYDLTLTCAGDGVVRGFVDHSNVISMRTGTGWPTQGFAGVFTDSAAATFQAVHFCALTPASPRSRVIRTHVLRYGTGAAVAGIDLVPFRWHKRRGLLPWQYVSKNPEPPGNIAGGATTIPARPIPPAHWRSAESANSDLIVVDGTVWYLLRGNPRIDGKPAPSRIGVLRTEVPAFDGVHFTDPARHTDRVSGDTILVAAAELTPEKQDASAPRDLNSPSSAYVGAGRLLFLGRASGIGQGGEKPGDTVYSRFDVETGAWEHEAAQALGWSDSAVQGRRRIHGSPEVVALRHPVTDAYQAVAFQQLGSIGNAVMATVLLDNAAQGAPRRAPGMPVHSSLSRPGKGAIYGFRVMFDNGIYYLHYNDGPEVPDWPDRFVLAATLDPYAGPWVANPDTRLATSDYFRRGTPDEPDNAAIWQGTMVKLGGHYYLYYENYHATGDIDAQYADYAAPQVGSRVGYATA